MRDISEKSYPHFRSKHELSTQLRVVSHMRLTLQKGVLTSSYLLFSPRVSLSGHESDT